MHFAVIAFSLLEKFKLVKHKNTVILATMIFDISAGRYTQKNLATTKVHYDTNTVAKIKGEKPNSFINLPNSHINHVKLLSFGKPHLPLALTHPPLTFSFWHFMRNNI